MDDEKAKKAAEYRKKYEQKRLVKHVSFNLEKEKELVEFVQNEAEDFSNWVKEVIKEKIHKK
ncbi:TPA: hypothetical protein ACJJD0_001375 [Neisseria meningitidis]|uniref:hypothetical protein n=1 Tax=Neisseria TaxID=482 RepID=UPI000C346745|nr:MULTISPECIES: hypothetical protein [Neisseria]